MFVSLMSSLFSRRLSAEQRIGVAECNAKSLPLSKIREENSYQKKNRGKIVCAREENCEKEPDRLWMIVFDSIELLLREIRAKL